MFLSEINIFLLVILAIAVIHDIRFKKIPNLLTYPCMFTAIIYHTYMNGLAGFLFSLEGIGLGMAVLMIFYLMGGMGAGDVKLMGAVGGILGPKGVFIAFLFTAIVGGIYSLILLAFHGDLIEKLKRYGMILKGFILTKNIINVSSSKKKTKLRLCYGVAIAIGTMISLFFRDLI